MSIIKKNIDFPLLVKSFGEFCILNDEIVNFQIYFRLNYFEITKD